MLARADPSEVKMWAARKMFDVTGKGFGPNVGGFKKEGSGEDANEDPTLRSTIYAGWLCSNCKIVPGAWDLRGISRQDECAFSSARLIGQRRPCSMRFHELCMHCIRFLESMMLLLAPPRR